MTSTNPAIRNAPAAGSYNAGPEPLVRVVQRPAPHGHQGPRPFPGHRGQARHRRGPDAVVRRGDDRRTAVESGDPKRDEHLRSADFFDAEKYPHRDLPSRPRSTTTATASSRSRATSPSAASTRPVTLEGRVPRYRRPRRGATPVSASAPRPRSAARTGASSGTLRSRPAACSWATRSSSPSTPSGSRSNLRNRRRVSTLTYALRT